VRGDIVRCRANGTEYLRLIKSIDGKDSRASRRLCEAEVVDEAGAEVGDL
jgi:hypothetical protein